MYDWLADYTYAPDGSIWMVGGFGIIHREVNGEQDWYHIENELDHQFFTVVAISPDGEVWVGGTKNALYRFDGSAWINEGENLPNPYEDDFKSWVCYSTDISGIDFSPDGSPWVINNGIEIYTKVYNQWINFHFPKELLPMSGGGGCPLGIRVLSETDITIMRNGCCMSGPTGYHFDGETWNTDADFSNVEEILETRHMADREEFHYNYYGSTKESVFDNWPFREDNLLPSGFYPRDTRNYLVTSDLDDVLWIYESSEIYNNSTGVFQELYSQGFQNEDPEIDSSKILVFDTEAIYYEDMKRPYRLTRIINESPISNNGYIDVACITSQEDGQLWFYSTEWGLLSVNHGNLQQISKIPESLFLKDIGGIYVFPDDKVWIGSTGAIWEIRNL